MDIVRTLPPRNSCKHGFLLVVIIYIGCIKENFDFIFKICNDTLKISDSPLLYIWNWNQHFPMSQLIRLLHETSIPTVLIDHHTFSAESVNQNRVKNILILLNDCEDIIILIQDFADDEITKNATVSNTSILHHRIPFLSPQKRNYDSAGPCGYRLMNYCNDSFDCHFSLKNDKSLLNKVNRSEPVNRVRSSLISRIFNGENNLIFYIYKKDADIASSTSSNLEYKRVKGRSEIFLNNKSLTCDVRLLFKLMWQTFRGFGVLICPGERICYIYNPFSENIMRYTGGNSTYLGNSRFSMESKSLSVLYVLPRIGENYFPLEFKLQQAVFDRLLTDYFVSFLNCSLTSAVFYTEIRMSEEAAVRSAVANGLTENFDLIVFEAGVRVSEPWHYDYSTALDTSSLMFIAPRSGYWPQYFVVFKSFTPSVWMMILFASAFSISVHYLFRSLAFEFVRSIFTESELMSCESFSPSWSVYCYLICVSQQRLLFGRLFSGKLLFLVMTFSMLILTTLLQSEMITLISKRVRYSDVDTIEDLEASDLQIQSNGLERDRGLFGTDLINYRSINERLTDNYAYSSTVISNLIRSFPYVGDNESSDSLRAVRESNKPLTKLKDQLQGRQAQNLKTDAFLCMFPVQADQITKDVFLKFHFYLDGTEALEGHEQHYGLESIMNFPFSFANPKYSFFTKKFNDLILRLVDSGHIKSVIDQEFRDSGQSIRLFVELLYSDKMIEFRPFAIVDLGSGFMILAIGLLLSCLVFIIELLF